MKFRRLGAISLAAALMATSTAIVASADTIALTDDTSVSLESGAVLDGAKKLIVKYNNVNGVSDNVVLTIGFSISPSWSWAQWNIPLPTEGEGTMEVDIAELLKQLGVEDISALGGGKIAVWDGNKLLSVETSAETAAEETTTATTEAAPEEETTTETTEDTTADTTEEADEEADDEADDEAEDEDADDDEDWDDDEDADDEGDDEAEEHDAAFYQKADGTVILWTDNAEPGLYEDKGGDLTEIYGVVMQIEYDADEVADGTWVGGGIGANSPSTGWKQIEWSAEEGVKPITIDLENSTITWFNDAPIFQADDAYAQLWCQTWGGTVTVTGYALLDADGEFLDGTFTPAAASASTSNDTAAAGDVAAATDSSKGSPDTGIADVAAVAGLAVVAAGAVVVAKKRR